MREQARLRTEAGQFAVYATVKDVALDGLESALGSTDRMRLASWRKSDESGWFFIDSVDEAKLHSVRLERAIRRIAEGIGGGERRAHVILSGRLTDWEFRRDLQHLNDGLPVPKDPTLPPPPTAEELLISKLRHERRRPPPAPAKDAEKALVVLMAPLDPARVRQFAAVKSAPNVDAFLAQIETANLWRFARRPLDLEWLVEFWRTRARLGSLSEMLENSLAERVRETNPDRSRGDNLDANRALHAIERIGAALVFGRKDTINIPDSEIVFSEREQPLDLAQALPDWSSDDRTRLLARPIFDPATFGRARLHNDNQGIVRGYLTARWLHRLRQTNLSRAGLFDLLFATTYESELIKPSMQEAAAWLAIWDEDVAREVLRRDPSVLLTAGDPASLHTRVREAVLEEVIQQLTVDGQRLGILDFDSVKRFARPDLANIVRMLWSKHHDAANARDLLLRLIWLGELTDCADLVIGSAYGAYADRHTKIIAGRALAVMGDDPAKRQYVEFIKANCEALPNILVWNAIDGLFPEFLKVDDLLGILAVIDIADADGGTRFKWQAPSLIDRISARPDLDRLLRGLLDQLGDQPVEIGHIPDKREEGYLVAIAAAACRVLDKSPSDDAPTDTVDAAVTVGVYRRYGNSMHDAPDIAAKLDKSSVRRRLAFWRAAERLTGNHLLPGRLIEYPRQMGILGYSPKLEMDDIVWLITDAPERAAENERRLAINAAMELWRQAGRPSDLLARIETVALADDAMRDAYNNFISPPPESAELTALKQKSRALDEQAKAQQATRERSWVDFIDEIQKNPNELRGLRPISGESVDTRLYHLWLLLDQTDGATTRHAIASVAPLVPMLGAELAAALQDALIQHWRHWQPRLKSSRAANELNQISNIDCMGIAGISLEEGTRPHWADRLTADEARLAACYATVEINGFPSWLAALAIAKPTEVRSVLVTEVMAELSGSEPKKRFGILEDLSRADKPVIELMAPSLFTELENRNNLVPEALAPMLSIVARGLRDSRQKFVELAINRFNSTDDAHVCGLYLGVVFAVDSTAATDALMARLDTLQAAAQKTLVEQILPNVFDTGFRSVNSAQPDLTFESLERLVTIAFRTIRAEDDNYRPSGEAFSPDQRDNAQHARNAAFQQLSETPGRSTYDALLRLAENPDCPISRTRLYELAHDRAARDSESSPWPPSETVAFEQTAETAPGSPKDLQRLALRRLEDIQHDLLHADFAQGGTVKALPDEKAVQIWFADRLRLKQGRAYSVEREPHVVDEKEPDVRLRTKVGDGSVAIEIKVAESWTMKQLQGHSIQVSRC